MNITDQQCAYCKARPDTGGNVVHSTTCLLNELEQSTLVTGWVNWPDEHIETFKEFPLPTPEPCPKCGQRRAEIRWIPKMPERPRLGGKRRDFCADWIGCPSPEQEHLHMVCPCGYWWAAECKDREERKDGP